jgi:hypothetical protein
MSHPEFVLLHSMFHPEGTRRSAICLVKLLGISPSMDFDSNDVGGTYQEPEHHLRAAVLCRSQHHPGPGCW